MVDILIAGAGIAGLTFALSLPFRARILLVTKGVLGESNTRYAQGGLAAAIDDADDPDLHLQDTIAAGAGLVATDAARTLVTHARESVEWLIAHGTRFDHDHGRLALGKEGAHSRSRVLHAGGDATGAEIERALVSEIATRHDLSVLEHTAITDLRVQGGRCTGATVVDVTTGSRTTIGASVAVLALGGAGQLWAVTSNPAGATGDGIAIALRAGAQLADLEFTQFHPTVLDAPGHEPFLISEAVRGDGAWLRNDDGERFMVPLDPRAELAPRDIVARAIQAQRAGGSRVWLDLRHLDPIFVRRRFPTIDQRLGSIGIDMAADLIPVAPAAHYFMGGIAATPHGHTSIPGLLAIGEVSCTGVHGANRLASNSLLEGLVFGRLAAQALSPSDMVGFIDPPRAANGTVETTTRSELEALRRRIREIMRDDVAVVRSADSLDRAIKALNEIDAEPALRIDSLPAFTVRNMLDLSREIVVSARLREESRGGHYRTDHPAADPALDQQHQIVRREGCATPVHTFGPIAIDGMVPSGVQ